MDCIICLGELEDLFEITGVAMIDDVMRALLGNQLAPRICSGSADHRQPSRPRHLRRGDANAARQTIAYIPRLVALARDGDGQGTVARSSGATRRVA